MLHDMCQALLRCVPCRPTSRVCWISSTCGASACGAQPAPWQGESRLKAGLRLTANEGSVPPSHCACQAYVTRRPSSCGSVSRHPRPLQQLLCHAGRSGGACRVCSAGSLPLPSSAGAMNACAALQIPGHGHLHGLPVEGAACAVPPDLGGGPLPPPHPTSLGWSVHWSVGHRAVPRMHLAPHAAAEECLTAMLLPCAPAACQLPCQ